jgi:hypothetical protein
VIGRENGVKMGEELTRICGRDCVGTRSGEERKSLMAGRGGRDGSGLKRGRRGGRRSVEGSVV